MENTRPVVSLPALNLSNGPAPSPRRQTMLLLMLLLAVITVTMMLLQKGVAPSPMSSDGIPLPFGGGDSVLRGSIKTIGSKGIYPVTDVSFDNGETTEVLPVNTINFVLTPDSPTIAHGAPLSVALTSGKRIFGYKYTSRDAATERANVNATTFVQRFPGQFFVSGEQRSFDTFVSQFETDHGVQFRPLSLATIDKNARTIVIANDAATSVTTRGLLWCGDTIKNGTEQCDDGNNVNGDGCNSTCQIEQGYVCNIGVGAPSQCTKLCGDGSIQLKGADDIAGTADDEQCDDRNVVNGDGCSSTCRIESGYSCTGQPSVCTRNPVCGNGAIEGSETCDDGNTNPADGCSATCTVESGYICSGQPSQCIVNAICGNGVRESSEECDDGNNIANDTCDNTCHLVSTPF